MYVCMYQERVCLHVIEYLLGEREEREGGSERQKDRWMDLCAYVPLQQRLVRVLSLLRRPYW